MHEIYKKYFDLFELQAAWKNRARPCGRLQHLESRKITRAACAALHAEDGKNFRLAETERPEVL